MKVHLFPGTLYPSTISVLAFCGRVVDRDAVGMNANCKHCLRALARRLEADHIRKILLEAAEKAIREKATTCNCEQASHTPPRTGA